MFRGMSCDNFEEDKKKRNRKQALLPELAAGGVEGGFQFLRGDVK
jgi:hypothetical protein